jgi:hypothetical protein
MKREKLKRLSEGSDFSISAFQFLLRGTLPPVVDPSGGGKKPWVGEFEGWEPTGGRRQ